ncbi:MAG: hypothetical protein GXN92_00720 [Candidatus Micrarchaeota archaeon]|nr:hypothetical protein [Candidatus Micrarchaeota archaeon]
MNELYKIHPYLKLNGKEVLLPPPRRFIPHKRWNELLRLKETIEQHPQLIHISKKKVMAMIEQALRRHMHETERHSILSEGGTPKDSTLEKVEEKIEFMIKKYKQGQTPHAFDLGAFVEAHLQQAWADVVREYNGDMGVVIRGKHGIHTGLARSWTLLEHMYYAFSHPAFQENIKDKVALAFLRFIYGQILHPFIDGNGRAGRSQLNSELIAHGLPPLVITMKNRDIYLDKMEKVAADFNSDVRSYWKALIEALPHLDHAWRSSIIATLILDSSPPSVQEFIDWALKEVKKEGEIIMMSSLAQM